jgi:hypothetical protein
MLNISVFASHLARQKVRFLKMLRDARMAASVMVRCCIDGRFE